jgi:tetratricopeptide (TPR) repeat protein
MLAQRADPAAIMVWANQHARPVVATASKRAHGPSIRVGLLWTFPPASAMPTVEQVRRQDLDALRALTACFPGPGSRVQGSPVGRFCLEQVENACGDLAVRLHKTDPRLSLAAISQAMELEEAATAQSYSLRGSIRQSLGQRALAEQDYQRCLELEPDSAAALQGLADCARQRDDTTEAQTYQARLDKVKGKSR